MQKLTFSYLLEASREQRIESIKRKFWIYASRINVLYIIEHYIFASDLCGVPFFTVSVTLKNILPNYGKVKRNGYESMYV